MTDAPKATASSSRVCTSADGSSGEDAVLKILYLAIRNIGNNRGGELGTGTQGWKQALNAFAITFPDASTRQHEPQPHTKNLTSPDGWPTAPDILAAYRHVAPLT